MAEVRVTEAQWRAAKMIVGRRDRDGQPAPANIRRIGDAGYSLEVLKRQREVSLRRLVDLQLAYRSNASGVFDSVGALRIKVLQDKLNRLEAAILEMEMVDYLFVIAEDEEPTDWLTD